MPQGGGKLCIVADPTPEAKPSGTANMNAKQSGGILAMLPNGSGKLCLVADPSTEAKTAGIARWAQWVHGLIGGGGRMCIVADPTPEAKPGGSLRWRITPLDDGELGALAL